MLVFSFFCHFFENDCVSTFLRNPISDRNCRFGSRHWHFETWSWHFVARYLFGRLAICVLYFVQWLLRYFPLRSYRSQSLQLRRFTNGSGVFCFGITWMTVRLFGQVWFISYNIVRCLASSCHREISFRPVSRVQRLDVVVKWVMCL